MLGSAFAMLLHHAPTQYPARAARQWSPPTAPQRIPLNIPQSSSLVDSIPPELLTSGSRRAWLARHFRGARQWIPPSTPPERLASGSCRVSQSGSPVHPAKYLARAARQWLLPSIPPARQPSNIMGAAVPRSHQPPGYFLDFFAPNESHLRYFFLPLIQCFAPNSTGLPKVLAYGSTRQTSLHNAGNLAR